MCTAPLVATMGLQLTGGILQFQGAKASGAAKERYYDFLSKQNDEQAEGVKAAAEEQAGIIGTAASRESSELRRSTGRLVGRERAVMAANGLWAGSRTAEDIVSDTTTQEGRDLAAIRFNADVASWEKRRQAMETVSGLRQQSIGYQLTGKSEKESANLEAASTLLNTATQIGSTWSKWKSAKTPKA